MIESILLKSFISLAKDLIGGYLPKNSVVNVKLIPPDGKLIIQELKGKGNRTFEIKFEDVQPHLTFSNKEEK